MRIRLTSTRTMLEWARLVWTTRNRKCDFKERIIAQYLTFFSINSVLQNYMNKQWTEYCGRRKQVEKKANHKLLKIQQMVGVLGIHSIMENQRMKNSRSTVFTQIFRPYTVCKLLLLLLLLLPPLLILSNIRRSAIYILHALSDCSFRGYWCK